VLTLYRGTEVETRWAAGEAPQDLEQLGGDAQLLGYTDFAIGRGDVLFLRSASGGGYGDPLDREPEAVLRDVEEGLVSPEMASLAYGVVVDGTEVAAEATRAARKALRHERGGKDDAALGGSPPTNFIRPMRENLELVDGQQRCARCGHTLCAAGEDWAAVCVRRELSPERANPLLAPWSGQASLRQLCCPACGTLFDSDLVERNGA
jgi:N-methylhydantoinase B